MKKLLERRNQLVREMSEMLDKAEKEERAFTEEEESSYSEKMKNCEEIDALIKKKEELRAKQLGQPDEGDEGNEGEETAEQAEERAFENYCRTGVAGGETGEVRAEGDPTNMTVGANGAVIPKTIMKRIVRKVEEICPIYEKATKFSIKGEVDFPVIDEDSDTVKMEYADEFDAENEKSHVPVIKKVRLSGYLAHALALVSKSLIKNADVDIVSIVVTQIAIALKRFFEKELLKGTAGKMTGASSTGNVVTATSQTAITPDELIDLQGMIKTAYQGEAAWYMSEKTRDAIRKLKDADGRYLLEWDFKEYSGGRLLGKPVYLSENIDDIAAGKDVILYGDASGLYMNVSEAFELDVLKEKYSHLHAVGFEAWVSADSKIVEVQKLAKLKMAG